MLLLLPYRHPCLVGIEEGTSRLVNPFLIFTLPDNFPELLTNFYSEIGRKNCNIAFAAGSVNNEFLRPNQRIGANEFFWLLKKLLIEWCVEGLLPQEEAELRTSLLMYLDGIPDTGHPAGCISVKNGISLYLCMLCRLTCLPGSRYTPLFRLMQRSVRTRQKQDCNRDTSGRPFEQCDLFSENPVAIELYLCDNNEISPSIFNLGILECSVLETDAIILNCLGESFAHSLARLDCHVSLDVFGPCWIG